MVPGEAEVVNGRDCHFNDSDILKFLVVREFDVKKVLPDLKYHLEWRQTNIPRPVLTDRMVYLLNKGIFYIHGRCKDYSPMIFITMKNVSEFIKKKEIEASEFCQLSNFFTNYVKCNMLVKG